MILSNFFKKLGFSKENSVVGIDIGYSSLKIVQLKKDKGIAKLETYGEIALGPYNNMSVGQAVSLPPEKISEALKDLFGKVNVTATIASLSVPLKSSFLTLIEIPKFKEKEIEQIIPIEARKYIPVPMSEVILDWLVLPKREFESPSSVTDETGEEVKKIEKIEVLIVAIHKSAIAFNQEIISKIGLTALPMEIETFSASRSVLGNEINALAILDIGATATRLLVIDYGVPRMLHTIGRGSQDITLALQRSLNLSFAEAEEAKRRLGTIGEEEGGDLYDVVNPTMDFIFYEAKKVLLNYQKKYSRSISKIILIGGGSQLKGIVELAKKKLEMDAELGNAFKKVEVPAIAEKLLADSGSGFAVAVGLALRGL